MCARSIRALMMIGVLLCAGAVLAQNPTGTLTGRVSYEDEPLPGVTVSVSSPALQGTKTAITGANGDYSIKFLPPGDYRAVFSLDSFRTLEYNVKISVAQAKTVDAVMYPEAVTEEIIVTSNYDTISASTGASVTYEQQLIEELPITRTIQQAALLSPGVAGNAGHANAVNIAGAPGPQSLFMVNGVVANDTIWGNAYDIYIEDAIEETTTSVSGISAEYGRFTGGVINMITKSGGNEFSGSYRLNLDNDDWAASTPLTTAKEDKINRTHEATLGGYIMKDRLWFFLAGRSREVSQQNQMYDETPYPYTRSQDRYEGKLTFSPHPSHRLLGSYMEVADEETGYARLTPVESSAIISRETPQDMFALNYTGVLTENLFVEGQYSERNFTFAYGQELGGGGGGRAENTTLLYYVGPVYMGGAHLFCSSACPGGDEERNNEQFLVKGSYFLSSETLGTHDIVFGYDRYDDIFLSNNYQSPSNFVVYNFAPPPDNVGGVHYPTLTGDGAAMFGYWPILALSRGTDFVTDSIYVNDTWRMGDRWTFNIGARYDKNDGKDGSGNVVTDDSRISPRLGFTWDAKGDGEWLVHGSYSRYVAIVDAGEGGAAGGGSPSDLFYYYLGPDINLDAEGNFTPEYTTPEALGIMFDWFDSIGGLAATDYWVWGPEISGVNVVVPSLKSPYTDEAAIGFTKRFGSKGLLRADYVYRTGGDFYVDRTDLGTGQVSWSGAVAPGVVLEQDFDLTVRENDSDILSRTYHGLHAMFQYRLNDRLSLGGNWTWSHLYGNFNGENASNGISVDDALQYPEYQQATWSYPDGDLAQDQRHRVRAFAVWEAISSARHNLTVSWMENFWSGTPYSATQSVYVSDYVDNPGYLTPPSTNTYYFSGRGAYTTDDIHRSDLALNYSFFADLFGADVELFIQPEVQNLFDENGVIAVETTTYSSYNSSAMADFDPFTETPVEGVNWRLGDDFGQPGTENDYQLPRTFRVSLGIRF